MRISNARGFSLVEALVGVALLAIFSVTAAYVVAQNSINSTRVGIQVEIDQVHQFSLNYLQRVKTYTPTVAMPVTTTTFPTTTTTYYSPGPSGPLPTTTTTIPTLATLSNTDRLRNAILSFNSPLGFNCLQNTIPNTACNALNGTGPAAEILGYQGVSTPAAPFSTTCTGAVCNVASRIEFKYSCANGTCQYIEIVVRTPDQPISQNVGGGTTFIYKERRGILRIPATVFSKRSENVTDMDLTCVTAGELLTSLNYNTRIANCVLPSTLSCGASNGIYGTAPAMNCVGAGIGACSSTTPIKTLGLLLNQPTCGAAVGLLPLAAGPPIPPGPTSTTTTVTGTTTTIPTPTTTMGPVTCTVQTDMESYAGCNGPGTGDINGGPPIAGLPAWTAAANAFCSTATGSGTIGSYCLNSNIPSNPHLLTASCNCAAGPPAGGSGGTCDLLNQPCAALGMNEGDVFTTVDACGCAFKPSSGFMDYTYVCNGGQLKRYEMPCNGVPGSCVCR